MWILDDVTDEKGEMSMDVVAVMSGMMVVDFAGMKSLVW